MKIDEIRCNPSKSTQEAQIQPCSWLLARIQGSNILSCRGTSPSNRAPQAAKISPPEHSQVHEIQTNPSRIIKIDEIQCKSSQGAQIQPCSLLLARIQGFKATGSSSHQIFDSSVVERSAAEASAYKSGRGFPEETLQAVGIGTRRGK